MLLIGIWLLACIWPLGMRGDAFPASIFLILIYNQGVISGLIEGISLFVVFGLTFLVGFDKVDWRFNLQLGLTLSGFFAWIAIFVALFDADLARNFWSYGEQPDKKLLENEQRVDQFFQAKKNFSLTAIIFWYIGLIGLQIGFERREGFKQ